MAPVTTHNKPKPFTWSYSRLKNFETCPKRHWHIDIAKDAKEDEQGEALLWGNEVHKHLALRIKDGTELPSSMAPYEKWVQKLVTGGGNVLVEQQLAITKEFSPCAWFDRTGVVWFRAIADYIKIVGDVALTVDWKTGKIVEDSQQLALAAACIFAHHPEVNHIRSHFIWLKEDADTREDFNRVEMVKMWRAVWPRIQQLEHAHDTLTYPAKPGYLCRSWCPVKQCPHHGE